MEDSTPDHSNLYQSEDEKSMAESVLDVTYIPETSSSDESEDRNIEHADPVSDRKFIAFETVGSAVVTLHKVWINCR